jgi:iron(III) transport system substrate-binding protein
MIRSVHRVSILFLLALPGMSPNWAQVVVYTSVDEILSAPIIETIGKKTGLEIRPVFDSEATKTTGLYLRILQEHPNTRADVFWNSEFSRTLLLQKEGSADAPPFSIRRGDP